MPWTGSRSTTTLTRPVGRPTSWRCSPSGTSSVGLTSSRSSTSWTATPSSTPATSSTRLACAASATHSMPSVDPDVNESAPGGRYVVAGAAGFIGFHLCQQLLAEGHAVVGIDNLCTGSRRNVDDLLTSGRFTFVEADVCSALTVDGPVTAVLNLASPASPKDYARLSLETLLVGSEGARNTLELARAKDADYLLASTSEVYGEPLEHPQRETYWGNVNPIGPRSVYDESKRFAEALTSAYRRERGLDTGIVRIFNTYGPRMRANDGRAVPAFMSQAITRDPLTVAGDGSQTRSLCFVTDTVEGLLAMAATHQPGPVNLGSSDEVTMLSLAERIRDLAGSDSSVQTIDLPVDDPKRRRPDTSLARDLLGWRPLVGLDEGLSRTLEWFLRQQPRVSAAAARG